MNEPVAGTEGGVSEGCVQKVWLKETLRNSTATFKVLASPVPWTADIKPGSNDPCAFGLMRFDTTKANPQVAFEFVDINGKVAPSFTLRRSALTR